MNAKRKIRHWSSRIVYAAASAYYPEDLKESELVLLYKQVLGREDLALENIVPAKRPQRLPTVFDRSEIGALFTHLQGTPQLVATLLHGAGLRLLEGLHLRIQDIDFERSQIVVRSGKGAKDRVTSLPPGLVQPIRHQMVAASRLYGKDLAAGLARLRLFARKSSVTY